TAAPGPGSRRRRQAQKRSGGVSGAVATSRGPEPQNRKKFPEVQTCHGLSSLRLRLRVGSIPSSTHQRRERFGKADTSMALRTFAEGSPPPVWVDFSFKPENQWRRPKIEPRRRPLLPVRSPGCCSPGGRGTEVPWVG